MTARAASAHFHGGPLDGRCEPLVVSEAFTPGETVSVTHPDPEAAVDGHYLREHTYVLGNGAIVYEYRWCDGNGEDAA